MSCLASLANLEYPKEKFEVILVDNGSTDGSVESVRTSFPFVRIVILDRNYGFCLPNNIGAESAQGDFLVFLNNDTVVTTGWLQELVGCINGRTDVKCVASKLLFADRKNVINAAGGMLAPIGSGYYIGYGDNDSPYYSRTRYVGFGCGAAVLVEKAFFLESGGFDPDYFACGEEHDLGWRTWLFGYEAVYAPKAVVFHWESGTFGQRGSYQPIKIYYIVRNRLLTLVKNAEISLLAGGMICSIAFDLYRSVVHTGRGNMLGAKYISLAYVDFIKNLKKVLSKRRLLQAKRRRSDGGLRRLHVMASFSELIREERRLLKVMDEYHESDKFHAV